MVINPPVKKHLRKLIVTTIWLGHLVNMTHWILRLANEKVQPPIACINCAVEESCISKRESEGFLDQERQTKISTSWNGGKLFPQLLLVIVPKRVSIFNAIWVI